jgi:NAD(P)H-hydrate epimerase
MASSDLAAGGMGDVLAGVAASLMAQGVAPDEAGALALYGTGRAAARAALGPSLTPSDVIEHLAAVWTEEGEGDSDLDYPFVIFDQDPAR